MKGDRTISKKENLQNYKFFKSDKFIKDKDLSLFVYAQKMGENSSIRGVNIIMKVVLRELRHLQYFSFMIGDSFIKNTIYQTLRAIRVEIAGLEESRDHIFRKTGVVLTIMIIFNQKVSHNSDLSRRSTSPTLEGVGSTS